MKESANALILFLKQKIKYMVGLTVLSIALGLFGGFFGALFSKTITFVTTTRENNDWLIYLLPIGGILTVALTKAVKLYGVGTNQVFESVLTNKKVSFLLAPLVFVCSAITHLFGGSAGREGAALQLGGGTADLFCRIFKLNENIKRIAVRSAMAAFFSAIFGTPIAASVFVLEVITVGRFFLPAVFPVFISSLTAFFTSNLLGVKGERFAVLNIPDLSVCTVCLIVVLSVLTAVVGVGFCKSIHLTERLFKRYIKNPYLIALIGGGIIVLLTLLVGVRDYNGGGIDVISRIFEKGEVRYEAFLFKIIFTAITVAAGYKGGEIIPTLFIGAAFGGAFGVIVGADSAIFAAIGMTAMFSAVTNSPLASLFLAIEMFGSDGIIYYAIGVFIAFAISGKCSLYSSQVYKNE